MVRRQPGETYSDLIRSARDAFRRRDDIAADRLSREALKIDPMFGDAYNVLALVRERGGELLIAQDLWRAALAVEPTYRAAMSNLERATRWGIRDQTPTIGDEDYLMK